MNINEFARYTTTYEDAMPRIAIECLAASHNVSTEGVLDKLSPFFQSLANKLKRLSINQITRNKGEIGDLRSQLHKQTNYAGDRIEIESKHCNEMFQWFTTGQSIQYKDILKACESTKACIELFEESLKAIIPAHITADTQLSKINKPFAAKAMAFNKSDKNLIPHGYKVNFDLAAFGGLEGCFSLTLAKVHSRTSGSLPVIIDKADFHKLDPYIAYFEKVNLMIDSGFLKFVRNATNTFNEVDKELKSNPDRKKELDAIKLEINNAFAIASMGYMFVAVFIHEIVVCLIAYHKLYLKHGI